MKKEIKEKIIEILTGEKTASIFDLDRWDSSLKEADKVADLILKLFAQAKQEENEFGIKKTNNRLCLLCRKYISKKEWKKHLLICEKKLEN